MLHFICSVDPCETRELRAPMCLRVPAPSTETYLGTSVSDVGPATRNPAKPGNQPHRRLSPALPRSARRLTAPTYKHTRTHPSPCRASKMLCSTSRSCPTSPSCLCYPTNPPQFTAKSLNRQSLKAGKEEQAEKTKLEKVRRRAGLGNTRILITSSCRP